jgi:hypothetical protein
MTRFHSRCTTGRSAWTLTAALLFGLTGGCGSPRIPLGVVYSGTLTSSDETWSETDGYGDVINGYDAQYVVQVTGGDAYTVKWGTDNGKGNFEDEEGGYFDLGGGVTGTAITDAYWSEPLVVTWHPAVAGLNKVDVEAQAQNVPFTFHVEITPQ